MERTEIELLRLEIQRNVMSFGAGVVTSSLSPAHIGYLTKAVRADVPARVHLDAPRLTETGWQCVIDGPVYETEAEALVQTLLDPPVNHTPGLPFSESEEYRPWGMTDEEIGLSLSLSEIEGIRDFIECGAVGYVEDIDDSAIVIGISAERNSYALAFIEPFEGNSVSTYDADEFVPAAIAQNLGLILGYIESVSDGGPHNWGIALNPGLAPNDTEYVCRAIVLGATIAGSGDTMTLAAARCAIKANAAILEAARWEAARFWSNEQIRAAAFSDRQAESEPPNGAA